MLRATALLGEPEAQATASQPLASASGRERGTGGRSQPFVLNRTENRSSGQSAQEGPGAPVSPEGKMEKKVPCGQVRIQKPLLSAAHAATVWLPRTLRPQPRVLVRDGAAQVVASVLARGVGQDARPGRPRTPCWGGTPPCVREARR